MFHENRVWSRNYYSQHVEVPTLYGVDVAKAVGTPVHSRKSSELSMAPKAPGGKDKGAQNTNSNAEAKIHCDEAAGHLKTGNYTKALNGYNTVSTQISDDMTQLKTGNFTKGLVGYNVVSTHSSDDMTTTAQGRKLHQGS